MQRPSEAIWHPSKNFGPRKGVDRPDLIVLHYTAMATPQAALERLCSSEFEVSAHYLIGENGMLWQMVAEDKRAWHAGAGAWGTVRDVNSHSIGIELANTGRHPFPEPQMSRLETLIQEAMCRWSIPAHRVIGHSDMAPERKADPGRRFDWRRLAQSGLAIWPGVSPPEAASLTKFRADAIRFGYDPKISPELCLSAFRQRFRPHANGPLDSTDCMLIADLAARYPVDPGQATS